VSQPDADLFERIVDWALEFETRTAERVDEHPWGAAYLSFGIPRVWDASWILIEQPGLSVEEIVGIADEALGGAGFEHRTVAFRDPAERDRAFPGLEALGWERDSAVYMVLRRDPEREPEAEAEEVGLDQIFELRRRLISGDLPAGEASAGADTVEQLLEWDRRVGGVGGDRWFAARGDDGEFASCCCLLSLGAFGQVENVGTLPAARDRGLGRAVTLAAARASVDAGHDLTFLGAVVDDWPRFMYDRLGFDAVGVDWAYRLRPGRA
jgi:ribosomal protein S18 acetylase RimI-like enzyme